MDVEAELDRAAEHEHAGRYADAIAILDAVLAAHPRHGEALLMRGTSRFRSGDLERAIADYGAAAELLPDQRDPHYNLGIACSQQADIMGGIAIETVSGERVVSPNDAWYARAIAAFDKALAIDPADTKSLVMRGQAWRKRLDDERAKADFKRAAELGDPIAPQALAHYWPSP